MFKIGKGGVGGVRRAQISLFKHLEQLNMKMKIGQYPEN